MKPSERLDCAKGDGDRVLKVDHAGENGAVNIYSGQLFFARFTAAALVPELREFRQHEMRHRQIFQTEMERRGVRRCRSFHLCGVGGYALGLVTGLMGCGAIAATTVAVERVVLGHLKDQIRTLEQTDPAATTAIRAIVADEQEHHDRSEVHARANRMWLALLAPMVALSTEVVIWMGMRL